MKRKENKIVEETKKQEEDKTINEFSELLKIAENIGKITILLENIEKKIDNAASKMKTGGF